jgi:hypothetical protein
VLWLDKLHFSCRHCPHSNESWRTNTLITLYKDVHVICQYRAQLYGHNKTSWPLCQWLMDKITVTTKVMPRMQEHRPMRTNKDVTSLAKITHNPSPNFGCDLKVAWKCNSLDLKTSLLSRNFHFAGWTEHCTPKRDITRASHAQQENYYSTLLVPGTPQPIGLHFRSPPTFLRNLLEKSPGKAKSNSIPFYIWFRILVIQCISRRASIQTSLK